MESQYITAEQLYETVKAGQNGRFLKTYADELGVSYQFLSKVLKGLCGPGDQIAKSLGYEQISVFRKIPEGLLAAAKAGHKAIVDEATKPFKKARPEIPAEGWRGVRTTNLKNKAGKKKATKKRVIGPNKGQYRVVRAGKKKAAKKPSVKPKKRATPRKAKK